MEAPSVELAPGPKFGDPGHPQFMEFDGEDTCWTCASDAYLDVVSIGSTEYHVCRNITVMYTKARTRETKMKDLEDAWTGSNDKHHRRLRDLRRIACRWDEGGVGRKGCFTEKDAKEIVKLRDQANETRITAGRYEARIARYRKKKQPRLMTRRRTYEDKIPPWAAPLVSERHGMHLYWLQQRMKRERDAMDDPDMDYAEPRKVIATLKASKRACLRAAMAEAKPIWERRKAERKRDRASKRERKRKASLLPSEPTNK